MIAVREMGLRIGGAEILHDVSFDIAAGQIVGLVGESGSGKSMTALALMGLLPRGAQARGQAMLEELDLLRLSEGAMQKIRGNEIGMIFQEPMTALNPVQSIGAQIAETLRIHGERDRTRAEAIAREKLDRVGLSHIGLDRYPHELSGGQRQRVCIAAAIARRPRLLIADEPTTALDVTTQAQILALLRDLVADEGMALMLITHDLAVVSDMADHVAVMEAGRIVEQGPTAQVLTRPAHPYTKALFAASSHQPARQERALGAPVLQAEGVRRLYPGERLGIWRGFRRGAPTRAVDGVSLSIRQGESVGLVGASGCGKSTLTRALLGLEPVQAGQITLDGVAVSPTMARSARAAIQVVFQDPYGSFNPRWPVARIVAEPFHLLPERPADAQTRVGHALEAVGLAPSDAAKFPHEFSGGQRQRIAIARALITRPKVIVLDEAVSALDVRIRAQVLDLLADLRGRFGLSYLFISHDLNVVRAITDRVLVMEAGRIVEEGETEAVFNAPAHATTRTLLEAAPRLPQPAKTE